MLSVQRLWLYLEPVFQSHELEKVLLDSRCCCCWKESDTNRRKRTEVTGPQPVSLAACSLVNAY